MPVNRNCEDLYYCAILKIFALRKIINAASKLLSVVTIFVNCQNVHALPLIVSLRPYFAVPFYLRRFVEIAVSL